MRTLLRRIINAATDGGDAADAAAAISSAGGAALLLNAGADCNAKTIRCYRSSGRQATRRSRGPDHGANVQARSNKGGRRLSRQGQERRAIAADALRGADPDARDGRSNTALMHAAGRVMSRCASVDWRGHT
jgi:hypothetical protein